MLILNKLLGTIQKFIRFIASLTIFLMMIFITVNVFFRMIGNPLIGTVEIVKLMMVIIIMFGLAYCEFEKFHISVEIFYERFPKSIQKFLLIFSYLLGAAVTLLISLVYFKVGYNSFEAGLRQTELLQIPLYPFEFVIAIGFIIWFLQIIVNLVSIREGGENDS
ncbi:TRAP transporter small permease [Virgibacillus ainsalahensis]